MKRILVFKLFWSLCQLSVSGQSDTTPPEIQCPPPQRVLIPEDGNCYLVVTYPDPEVTDDSGEDVNVLPHPSSGSIFDYCTYPIGQMVIVRATDTSGNVATCSFFITWIREGETTEQSTQSFKHQQATTPPITTSKIPTQTTSMIETTVTPKRDHTDRLSTLEVTTSRLPTELSTNSANGMEPVLDGTQYTTQVTTTPLDTNKISARTTSKIHQTTEAPKRGEDTTVDASSRRSPTESTTISPNESGQDENEHTDKGVAGLLTTLKISAGNKGMETDKYLYLPTAYSSGTTDSSELPTQQTLIAVIGIASGCSISVIIGVIICICICKKYNMKPIKFNEQVQDRNRNQDHELQDFPDHQYQTIDQRHGHARPGSINGIEIQEVIQERLGHETEEGRQFVHGAEDATNEDNGDSIEELRSGSWANGNQEQRYINHDHILRVPLPQTDSINGIVNKSVNRKYFDPKLDVNTNYYNDCDNYNI
ncbi:uncharacterized protein [Amphiura filiformis]|uniref:uncharacterized protein isoform X2 n=1 Tax=Amphiura filiformis TaxID=82378 RepID=UPI003B20DE0D